MLRTLDEAVPLLTAQDEFVLGYPFRPCSRNAFDLPTVDPAEFPEMVRIQIEKALPFSADEVTTDFEVIEQTETGAYFSGGGAKRTTGEIAAPLLKRITSRSRSQFMLRNARAPMPRKEMLSSFTPKAKPLFPQ